MDLYFLNDKFQEFIYSYKKLEKTQHFMLQEKSLTLAEVHMLVLIKNNPSSSMSNLAKKQEISRSAMTQMVNKLLKKELIYKTKSEKDAKVYSLVLTNKGLEIYDIHQSQQEYLLEQLSVIFKEHSKEFLEECLSMMIEIQQVWENLPWIKEDKKGEKYRN